MLACHIHWTHEELMSLDHAERRRWMSALTELEEEARWTATGRR